MFFRSLSFALALVLACSSVAVCATPQASMDQRGETRDDQYQQEQQTQPLGLGTQLGINPAQTQEEAPASIPTVVLDDSRTVPPQQQNAPKQGEQNQLPLRTKPKARTVELTDFQQMVATSLGQTLSIYGMNLFEEAPTTFAPVDHAPVTSDYVIGPGTNC